MTEPGTTPSVEVRVVGITDVGRVREHNEDSFLVMDRDVGRPLASGETHDGALSSAILMVVCDGMGGAAAGEVASHMAAERVADVLSKADYATATPDQVSSLMDQSIQQANRDVYDKAKSTPEMKGMGTTLTAAVVTPGRLFVSQVGDSRAYLLRKGLLNQITKDQSLIGQLIEEGTLTEEEAEKLGGRNIVLQAVGVEENLRVDTKSWPLLRGDVVLLCSDGLSGMVKDPRMREILIECGADLHAAGTKLIAEANANGGRDNITCVLGRFDGEGLRPPMETEAAGAIEAAGASFKAPPPPEVPNPMKKVALWGGILLAVIVALFAVFRPTKAYLSIPVKPAGAQVELKTKDGKVVGSVVAGADPVKFDAVEPGDYQLAVTATNHYELTQDLPIKEHGRVDLPGVWLLPEPGKVVIQASDPDVTVKFSMKASHPKGTDITDEVLRLPELGAQGRVGNVHVGHWVAVASRPGFRTLTLDGEMTPKEEKKIVVPKLEEVKGTLVVEGCRSGRVRVTTDSGEPLVDVQAAGERWEGGVRAVKVSVRVSWKDFRDFSAVADVTEGGPAVVRAEQVADKVEVTIKGPPRTAVEILRKEGDRWVPEKIGALIQENGAAFPKNLAPGSYRAQSDDRAWQAQFDVAPGGAAMTVELRQGNR